MPVARREKLLAHCDQHDIVVIEDDHESELNFRNQPSPALKSLDTNGRVIYLGSLSKTLAHGLRIGYVVAPARLIDELRALRRLMVRHPPTNNEHTAARFIKHGFHESFVRKLNLAYRQRAELMKAALTRELPTARWSEAAGGSALWVRLPRGADTRLLARRALAEGIVIEPGDVFFHREGSRAQMRLGYSSIPPDRIGPGIARLARLVATAGSCPGATMGRCPMPSPCCARRGWRAAPSPSSPAAASSMNAAAAAVCCPATACARCARR
jgi:GntR family transcriptional regulator/MocR family aminotransferase